MAIFNVKAYTVELYEDKIEAASEEEAQDKLIEKWENQEIESEETQFIFEDNEGFDVLEGLFVEEDSED